MRRAEDARGCLGDHPCGAVRIQYRDARVSSCGAQDFAGLLDADPGIGQLGADVAVVAEEALVALGRCVAFYLYYTLPSACSCNDAR